MDLFDVRRTDAADRDLDQKFIRPDPGNRNRFDPEIVSAAINGRLHGLGNLEYRHAARLPRPPTAGKPQNFAT